MDFPSTVFQTVVSLTFKTVLQPDFRSVDFQTVIEYEIHPLLNKK